ncbi:hypothetical protein CDL12_02410 [Handroanthus impetiginosus]|uniref:Dirigent protein n=1 Tax=Handroanthus impetiginosus TaxID=429701 RepID=A0A2G9I517_9LAMI|nr:hypothetical protein CDL12_02410 [Handroanthus impetiginosus]
MEKIFFVASILILSIWAIPVHSNYYSKSIPYDPIQLKKTHLHFYLHDILSGKNPTAVQISGPKPTPNNPTPFGSIFALDDPITEGPELSSKVIGNAQGTYLSSNQGKDLNLVLSIDIGFTAGKFNGSSISVFSRNPVTEKHREIAIVGGRGRFRYARGFIAVNTYYLNTTNGDAVLEYNAEIIHH